MPDISKLSINQITTDAQWSLREAIEGYARHNVPAICIWRHKLAEVDLSDEQGSTELYKTLLELNASDVVHGAYGLEDGELILSDTLELETLDFGELQASVESMQLAATGHMDRIRTLAGMAEG